MPQVRHARRAMLAALALALTLVAAAAAGPFEDALAAYNRRDFATALQLWQPLADQGNALAQYYLGHMHAGGYGVPQDHAEAAKWYRKAADLGFAKAQQRLAHLYVTGQGVPEDAAEAVKWYRKAADQGHAPAQYKLGLLYYRGLGVARDYVEAHRWYSLAAAGFSAALAKESDRVAKGRVQVERDAAAKNRDLVASQMTPAQVAAAQQLAREWKPK
jgi:TPR repeat protein